MQSALIVGFGSIGARHAGVLAKLGLRVAAVTRNNECPYPTFASIEDGLARCAPELVVVCTETSRHVESLEQLARHGYAGVVLVEKPLSNRPLPARDWPFKEIFVAYNLRFHPVIAALREMLATEKIIAAQIYAGQYLPDWRPDRDYRQTYSAHRDAGGGVLRDLSHELDYAQWIFGSCLRVAAIGGHFSALEIDSDDAWAVLMQLERCPMLTLQVNYLERAPRREITVNSDTHSYRADLIGGALWRDGVEQRFKCARDTTYHLQMQAIVAGHYADIASLAEGASVVDLVHRIEKSSADARWVEL